MKTLKEFGQHIIGRSHEYPEACDWGVRAYFQFQTLRVSCPANRAAVAKLGAKYTKTRRLTSAPLPRMPTLRRPAGSDAVLAALESPGF